MNYIVYEYPLNERIRAFLRLEYLLDQANHFSQNKTAWDSKNYCFTVIEIIDMLNRNELRKEIIKEFEKQIKFCNSLKNTKVVDLNTLNNTIAKLTLQLNEANLNIWTLTKKLNEDELLQIIRKRSAISSTACCFDSANLFYWLNQKAEIRQIKIDKWQNELSVVNNSIRLLLSLIRDSGLFENKKAAGGFYQQVLNSSQPCQMIRIFLPQEPSSFPEICGNKHQINIRFCKYDENSKKEPIYAKEDLEFALSCNTI